MGHTNRYLERRPSRWLSTVTTLAFKPGYLTSQTLMSFLVSSGYRLLILSLPGVRCGYKFQVGEESYTSSYLSLRVVTWTHDLLSSLLNQKSSMTSSPPVKQQRYYDIPRRKRTYSL